ncbi:hypothetical protein Moror_11044 [Moniliophthora roreri MCA 2997]|uniref:Uncharacterized protein n=2 Tax=Moniliophthora roreri TaxID=221103 RepID=V2WU18_MONRO|nr:hypothetical protein Moror_11044 [Moniliophthora roreri MCA 2997]KAI3609315.1 hypothetical protein WG66_010544 [Moniliophthora roreri]
MSFRVSVSSLIFHPSSPSLSSLDRSLLNISFQGQRRPSYTIRKEIPPIMKEYGLTKEQKERLGVSESDTKFLPSNSSATDSPGRGSLGAPSDRYNGVELERSSTIDATTTTTKARTKDYDLGRPSTMTASTGTTIRTKDYGDIGLGRPSTTSATTATTITTTRSKRSALVGLGFGLPSTYGARRNSRNNQRRTTTTLVKKAKFAKRRLFTIPEEGPEAFKFSPRWSPKAKEFVLGRVNMNRVLV